MLSTASAATVVSSCPRKAEASTVLTSVTIVPVVKTEALLPPVTTILSTPVPNEVVIDGDAPATTSTLMFSASIDPTLTKPVLAVRFTVSVPVPPLTTCTIPAV